MDEKLKVEDYNINEDKDDLIKKSLKLNNAEIKKFALSLNIPASNLENKTDDEIKSMVAKEIVTKATPAEMEEVRRKYNNLSEVDENSIKLERDLRQ